MANRQSERYVRYYTFGSAAQKLDHQQIRPALPKMKPQKKRKTISVDPVAFYGNAVALMLALLMAVGLFQLHYANSQVHAEQIRVQALEQEQKMLTEIYEDGYDLDEIRAAAESMGMIPVEEATHIQVKVQTAPMETVRMGWWDSLLANLRQMFA